MHQHFVVLSNKRSEKDAHPQQSVDRLSLSRSCCALPQNDLKHLLVLRHDSRYMLSGPGDSSLYPFLARCTLYISCIDELVYTQHHTSEEALDDPIASR